jgi:hypothetical protein
MVGCGLETLGEARMEDHWEVDHRDRLVEEWIYQVFQVNPPPPYPYPAILKKEKPTFPQGPTYPFSPHMRFFGSASV